MGNLKLALLGVLVVCGLSACAHTGQAGLSVKRTANQSLPTRPMSWAAVKERTGAVQFGWIAAFNDDLLTRLVREAQANNQDLRAAAANVEAARAMAERAGAALRPMVAIAMNGERAGVVNSGASSTFNLGLTASWEVDVWGRIRAGQQAAIASVESAKADYRYSQHSLAAGVARAYFVAIEAQLQKALTESLVQLVAKTKAIVQTQFNNGLSSAQDLALVNADLATAQAGLAAARGGMRDAARALELLLGRYPAADLAVSQILPALPAAPKAGLPSELLSRRPDIIAAERRIAVAMNATDQAKAAQLPQISLTGSLGGSSSQLSNLLSPGNVIWKTAANLLAPLFDGGARAAQVQVTTAEQKVAVSAYAQIALRAFGEVETALDQRGTLEKRAAALQLASEESATALKLAQLRFKEGESGLIDVLSVQQRVDTARSSLLSVRRAQLQQFVDLNLALGGDWRSITASFRKVSSAS